ncbi:hypothetical protein Sste5346_000312 [Sporothrix stenoceras]|uniref:Glycine zipper 2TM domain-containing protein n=1 Tax=Sporothrix stenoceras TaxID=5173 RepID=A0ABR3ZSK7_9PEZI
MSRHYDDDDDYRRRPRSSHSHGRHHRDSSPEEVYNDSAGMPPPYMTNAAGGGRLAYDPNAPSFPPPPNASTSDFGRHDSLQVPSSRHRPRSQPPALSTTGRSELSRRGSSRGDRSPSPDRYRDTPHSPLEKVKHAADKTFSTSKSGIGVGVLGALVGGFAAHEAAEAASRARDKRDHRHHGSKDHQKAALISTLVGAAVGGLGANAIGKRIEHHRQERNHDDDDYDRDRSRDRDHKPRELEYHGGGGGSRGISDRAHSRGRSSRGGDDSDDSYDGGRRGRRNNRERALVISRSPSASLSRSRSNSRNRHGSRIHPPQHGGAADSYYNSSRSYDGRDDRR